MLRGCNEAVSKGRSPADPSEGNPPCAPQAVPWVHPPLPTPSPHSQTQPGQCFGYTPNTPSLPNSRKSLWKSAIQNTISTFRRKKQGFLHKIKYTTKTSIRVTLIIQSGNNCVFCEQTSKLPFQGCAVSTLKCLLIQLWKNVPTLCKNLELKTTLPFS